METLISKKISFVEDTILYLYARGLYVGAIYPNTWVTIEFNVYESIEECMHMYIEYNTATMIYVVDDVEVIHLDDTLYHITPSRLLGGEL